MPGTITLPVIEVGRLNAIYATLPRINCQRLCSASCGPIGASKLERDRLHAAIGDMPTQRFQGITVMVTRKGYCPALNVKAGTCRAYAVRPLICRLYGLTRKMACPHGCEPERWLSDNEAAFLLKAAAQIGGPS